MKFRRYLQILHGQIIIIAVICLLGMKYFPDMVPVPRIEFMLDATITCASTFSGFTLTIVSILLSFSRSLLVELLKKNNGISELIFRYTLSLVLGILILLFCIYVGSTLPINPEKVLENIALSKCNVIIGLSIAFAYLYNLVISAIYLLRTIILAMTPVVRVSDESVEPKKGFRI